jgi:hypothetical protein
MALCCGARAYPGEVSPRFVRQKRSFDLQFERIRPY